MVDRIKSIPKAVTVICLGNICRSPAGEYLLGYYAKKSDNEIIQNIHFDSAGLMGGGSGGMSYYSKEYLEEKGIDCSKFRSTPIDKEYIDEFDLIIVMEEYMRNEILNEYYKNI
ncbi:MAG: hypothetical protein GY870_22145, partial [archaeon]|nr:hypothetical protein [archaeon]